MNFGFDALKTQGNAATTTSAATPGGFTFGATGAGDAGKQMAPGLTVTPVQNKPGGLFGSGITTPGQSTGFATPTIGATFGGAAPSVPATGLAFGASPLPSSTPNVATPNTATPTGFTVQPGAPTGFSLNTTTTATPLPNTGLSFGIPTPNKVVKGFTLGSGVGAQTSAITGFTSATPSTMAPSTTGFSLGGTTTAATTATTPFAFGNVPTTTPAATGLPQDPAKTSTIQTGFTLTPSTTAGFGITSTPATTTATGFSLSTAATTSATPGFTFSGGSTTAASTTGFMLNKTTAAVTAPSSVAAVTTHTTLGTTTTVTSSANAVLPGAINFCQLEESINKWTLELEEQEKVFVNQAAHLNAWDKLLIINGENIVTLNQEVERVKLEQQQLEHELDYVVGQRKELQDCLVPLEKELAPLSVSDPEREYAYRLGESIDTQLKQMSEDLKEIIEHLNEANRTQDSSDPIVQIGKILNAHTNSLEWLYQRTTLLKQKIQQIDQMHQNFRQENERSFNLAYN